jgi:hypothetical protein
MLTSYKKFSDCFLPKVKTITFHMYKNFLFLAFCAKYPTSLHHYFLHQKCLPQTFYSKQKATHVLSCLFLFIFPTLAPNSISSSFALVNFRWRKSLTFSSSLIFELFFLRGLIWLFRVVFVLVFWLGLDWGLSGFNFWFFWCGFGRDLRVWRFRIYLKFLKNIS